MMNVENVLITAEVKESSNTNSNPFTSQTNLQKTFTIPFDSPIDDAGIEVELNEDSVLVTVPKLQAS